jgi:hypothetical protein
MMVPEWAFMPTRDGIFRSADTMFPLIFSILWTVLSTVLIASTFSQLEGWERAFALLFPVFGLIFIHASWLRWRRRRTLRVEEEGGTTWYVWIELDGRPRRSTKDPRDEWDADDGDGGDGGD